MRKLHRLCILLSALGTQTKLQSHLIYLWMINNAFMLFEISVTVLSPLKHQTYSVASFLRESKK